MSLSEKLRQELGRLAPFAHGEAVVEASEGGQRLRCELVALDTLACAFTGLEVVSDALAGRPAGQLRAVAEALSKRLTYLLEPISPIEVDAEHCVVQMRSNPPQKDEGTTSYYELLVGRSGQIGLVRYARAGGAPRSIVPAHVTREVLYRLVGDFAAAGI